MKKRRHVLPGRELYIATNVLRLGWQKEKKIAEGKIGKRSWESRRERRRFSDDTARECIIKRGGGIIGMARSGINHKVNNGERAAIRSRSWAPGTTTQPARRAPCRLLPAA